MTSTARRRVDNVRLIPYLILLTAVMVGFHLYLNLVTDGVVDLIAAAILAVAAIVVLVGYLRWRRDLQRHAFGILVFHVLSYLIVVGSIAVHAFASTTAGANFRLTGGLVWLVALWSLGLFVHTLAANASRGFDGVEP